MTIKDDLEIFLITYNRCDKLKSTFEQLFSESSPIKDFDIKILDNCSTDKTEELCKEYTERFHNLTYIKNKRNIGAVNNVLKAMESASKKWLWILGDDDNYNWEVWPEIENALKQDYDIVNTCWHEGARSNEYCYLLNESGFIATSIYNTKHLTSLTLQNAVYLATTLNPHSAITAKVINENGKIYVPEQRLVIEKMDKSGCQLRPKTIYLYPETRHYNVVYATLKIYQLIVDKKLRYKCNEIICLGQSFENSMEYLFECGIDAKRITEILFLLNTPQRIILLKILCKHLCDIFLKISIDDEKIKIKLFGILKTHIRYKKKQIS